MMTRYTVFILVFLISLSYASAQDTDIRQEFTADTARIEQACRDAMNMDYSTPGMIKATYDLEEGYDALLNKYYKKLYESLDTDAQKVLLKSQRNWLKLRDSERLLVSELFRTTYEQMGGGTIWRVVAADAYADITRRRVIEIYNYLIFSDVGG